MDVGILVEVEGSYGEFYPGLITGLKSSDEYQVQLLDMSNNHVVELKLPPTAMRSPPELSSFPFDPMQGQEVDVLIPCVAASEGSETEGTGLTSKLSAWWPGRVKKVGGGFVIVELVSTFTTEMAQSKHLASHIDVINGRINIPLPASIEKTDIVEKHQLRPRSHQSNFTASSFHMHFINIPDSLVSYCREPSNYQHFARRCGTPVLMCMAPDALKPQHSIKGEENETYEMKGRLVVISTDITTIHRAAVIDNTFIDMLRQKVSILQQTEELSRKLEASRVSQVAAPFVEEVFVPEHLIPLAIGFQGSNIKKATHIDGVLAIKLNRSTCVFHISGRTKEAVLQAKAILDFATEIIPVPRAYVGPIVGSGQRHIQHIVDCVGLTGLKICDIGEQGTSDFVAFHLTGTTQAIRDARMFLEFHVASLQDLDRLRGVKNPPTLPPKVEHELENHVSTEETEAAGDAATGTGGRRKGGRSSHRNRHRQPNLPGQDESHPGNQVNGGERSNEEDHSTEPTHTEHHGEERRQNSRPHQRRPPPTQVRNNNARPHVDRQKGNNRGQPFVNGNAHKDVGGKPNQLHSANAPVATPVAAQM